MQSVDSSSDQPPERTPNDEEKGSGFTDESTSLSEEHRQYILQRHGTVDLDPMPTMDPADPYNWPEWKVLRFMPEKINLALVAFHAMMATFTSAAIHSSLVPISHDLHISLQRATYLIALVIAIIGCAPFFWRPLANRYGRRPIFFLSLLCSLAGNIGCAKSPSYATMALPAAALGSATVTETFFKRERATYMGTWTIMVTFGVPVAPFIFGFLSKRVDYRWIYWDLAIVNGIQFVLYFFLGPETLYPRDTDKAPPPQYRITLHPIDPRPITLRDILHPLTYTFKRRVFIPSIAHAMIFLWASITPHILIPQIFPSKFGLDTQQIGLQFLASIIGSVIGEQIGGWMSDGWMPRRRRVLGGKDPAAEYRLWLAYPGFALSIIGVVVFFLQMDKAGTRWDITPLVGVTFAAVGNQPLTTVLTTYAVDCYRPDAAAVGVFTSFVRGIWGFIGPFWLPNLIAATSFKATGGIAAAFMVVLAAAPVAWLQAVA
ncbi:major facilitator superfamily domain-containing protein [Roridomyces roridus]|uniref:Major facilitator superfamily domain-containing protein n=1 Tax=Roridomyces roridus TaxID=1738132 RepID=A0AAD7BE23_9AGAR|nr:major facilitator superfamily domain-containing protein [Roridomyces roridus]